MHLPDLLSIIVSTFSVSWAKLLAWGTLFFIFFLGDVHTEAITALFMLVMFDTVLGVMAARAEGIAFTSRKFARLPGKLFVYFVGISGAMFADMTTGLPFIQTSMIAFMGVTEFISILENMQRLGYETPKKLLNQLEGFKSQK